LNDLILENPYIPIVPSPKQAEFLCLPYTCILYGGGAGGGKSAGLLMAALMYAQVPGYNAMIMRRSYQDLALPSALMDMSREWLSHTDAHWNELKKIWTFPSGATLSFGYLDNVNAKFRYQGAEFQFIGLDEVTQIDKISFQYLWSRLRKVEGLDVPLRYYLASNPPSPFVSAKRKRESGQWVRELFVDGAKEIRLFSKELKEPILLYFTNNFITPMGEIPAAFVPALAKDNKHLDPSYYDSLNMLDSVTRKQLLYGSWTIQPKGGVFEPDWLSETFNPNDPQTPYQETLISADLAYKDTVDADYTAYQAWGRYQAHFYLIDQVRGQWKFPEAKRQFRAFCERFPTIPLKIVEDKAAGIALIQELGVEIPGLVPYNPGNKSKLERAQTISPYFESHSVFIPAPQYKSWVPEYVAELLSFPTGDNDDQVDATSQALIRLSASLKRRRILFGIVDDPVPAHYQDITQNVGGLIR
jgi:predicted phage terminase large subunit-like protein